jgi:hypothetical protein
MAGSSRRRWLFILETHSPRAWPSTPSLDAEFQRPYPLLRPCPGKHHLASISVAFSIYKSG